MRIILVSNVEEDCPNMANTENKLYLYLKKEGHQVMFFHQKPSSNGLYFLWMFLTFLPRYIAFNPDVILTFQLASFMPCFFRKFGFISKPIIYYSWDNYAEILGRTHPPSLMAFMEYFCLKNSDYVFTNSMAQASACHNLNIPCQHFPLGVEPYFKKKPNKYEIYIPGSQKVKIIYAGEQTTYKRFDKLLEAFSDVKNADLIVLGKINYDIVTLQHYEHPRIHFIGEVKHEDIPEYIRKADIVVIPGDQDGSLKMYEYLAMGRCIFAYRGKIQYMLEHGKNCWLDTDFRRGLQYLVDHPKLRRRLEKGAKRFKTFEINDIFKNHMEKIKEVLQQ